MFGPLSNSIVCVCSDRTGIFSRRDPDGRESKSHHLPSQRDVGYSFPSVYGMRGSRKLRVCVCVGGGGGGGAIATYFREG